MQPYESEPWRQALSAEMDKLFTEKARRLSGEIQGLYSQIGAGKTADQIQSATKKKAIRQALEEIVGNVEEMQAEAAKSGSAPVIADSARGLLTKFGGN